jgi:hypothetical protein
MVDADTIAEILRRNRRSLESATHALIKAANDRGGDDNITAILFAVTDGDGGEAATLMVPAAVAAVDPDDEDTLHPEDNVRLPDEVAAPPAEVTMVVSAAEIAKALEQQPGAPPQEQAPDLTVVHPAVVPPADTADANETGTETENDTESEAAPGEEEVEKASPLRIAIALLVIVVLAALIVLLVLNALPR